MSERLDPEWLAADPRVDDLQRVGLVGPDRRVIPALAERMAVLGAPEVEVRNAVIPPSPSQIFRAMSLASSEIERSCGP